MTKIITIFGGTGFVGSRCIKTLLQNVKDIQIYSVSRSFDSINLDKYDERVVFIKGDAFYPESLIHLIEKSTGIINTIGQLFPSSSDINSSYEKFNYQSALNLAKIVDDSSKNLKANKNFVFISAERGIMFPLSLILSGYLEYKRKTEEKLINHFSYLNPIILRPGLIIDPIDRPFLQPLGFAFDSINYLEKNIFNKISPNFGDCVNLPASSINLDTLAFYAAAGALGKLNLKIYSNDFMNDKKNMSEINLL